MKFFYVFLSQGNKPRLAYGTEVADLGYSEEIDCSDCNRQWRRSVVPETYEVALTNANYPDFLSTYKFPLVLEKTSHLMRENQISGFSTMSFPVISTNHLTVEQRKYIRESGINVKKMADNPSAYERFDIASTVHFHPSSNVVTENCNKCGYKRAYSPGNQVVDSFTSFKLDLSTWNGNDLFRIPYFWPKAIYCSERFFEFYHENQLVGLAFEEIEAI